MMLESFASAYRALLNELLLWAPQETNSRTGELISMLEGGHSFKVSLRRLPIAGNRRYWPRVAAAETAWQFLGTQSPDWILKKAPKLWSNFVENGKLKTAYGYRWRKHFGRDQLQLAIDELRDNPTNRQIYISAWDPAADGLGGPQPKNIPCPVGFSLTRTRHQLHCSLFIRSSDVFVGLPYDVMGYALTTAAIARSIGCQPGTMHVTLAHPHFYHIHLDAVKACIVGDRSEWTLDNVEPLLPHWPVESIVNAPDEYLHDVTELSKAVNCNPWNPLPQLVL